MSIGEILIKILLFFGIFYGAIGITALISKKIRDKNRQKKDTDTKQKQSKRKN